MAILLFIAVSLALLWMLLLLTVSPFFRGMAMVALGVSILNIAYATSDSFWLLVVGAAFVLLPVATVFRRFIFGE
jgi:hypothetical protein